MHKLNCKWRPESGEKLQQSHTKWTKIKLYKGARWTKREGRSGAGTCYHIVWYLIFYYKFLQSWPKTNKREPRERERGREMGERAARPQGKWTTAKAFAVGWVAQLTLLVFASKLARNICRVCGAIERELGETGSNDCQWIQSGLSHWKSLAAALRVASSQFDSIRNCLLCSIISSLTALARTSHPATSIDSDFWNSSSSFPCTGQQAMASAS